MKSGPSSSIRKNLGMFVCVHLTQEREIGVCSHAVAAFLREHFFRGGCSLARHS